MADTDADTLKLYTIDIAVRHTVEVEAYSDGEAEELAYDIFLDEQSWWDDVEYDIVDVEDLEGDDEA